MDIPPRTLGRTLLAAGLGLGGFAVHGPLRILSAQPGVWKAGVQHPAEATHPPDTFTAEQLEELRGEPKLAVQEAGDRGPVSFGRLPAAAGIDVLAGTAASPAAGAVTDPSTLPLPGGEAALVGLEGAIVADALPGVGTRPGPGGVAVLGDAATPPLDTGAGPTASEADRAIANELAGAPVVAGAGPALPLPLEHAVPSAPQDPAAPATPPGRKRPASAGS